MGGVGTDGKGKAWRWCANSDLVTAFPFLIVVSFLVNYPPHIDLSG